MKYAQYITKKRMKAEAICGPVNIPWGTVLPVEGEYITYKGLPLCAVGSQNSKEYFWGYDRDNPQPEIDRQKAAADLLATAPKENGDSLASTFSPWKKYGHLEQIPGAWLWVWDSTVADLPRHQLDQLLACTRTGATPQEVQV